jgi:hypothetical protein
VELTRRSFLAGLGSVTVGLLFARKLDAVLKSLEHDLIAEQQSPEQQPSAAEIVVQTETAFRATHLVVASAIAPMFVIEDIRIGYVSQLVGDGAVSAELFSEKGCGTEVFLAASAPGVEIRFRVRYVGADPRGARFRAVLIGRGIDGGGLRLPIDSGCAIV